MPLLMAECGERLRIRAVKGKDNVKQHLAELGFIANAEIIVINKISGSLIIQVKDSRVALDKSMAARIII